MARKGRHKKGGRVTPKGTRPRGVGPRREPDPFDGPPPAHRSESDEPDLLRDVRDILHNDDRLALLAFASSIVTLGDPRTRSPFDRSEPAALSLDVLIDSFIDVELPETSALLSVFAELIVDPGFAGRIRVALDPREASLPDWLARLGDAEVHRAVEMVDVLGDGDNILLGLRLPDGDELTLVAYTDHNLGTKMKDGFAIPEGLDDAVAMMKQIGVDPDTEWRDLPLADARARITDAIERGARTYPPFESDSWPECRPLLEWATRTMPEGGLGYERPEWTEADKASLAQRFLASTFARGLDDPDHGDLLDTVLWFGTDYGPGDPLRWSGVAVEILLIDWFPRKVVADAAYLSKLPDLLRAFIRFCHAELGIRADLTADTLAAVDEYEPEYQRLIRSDRPQGAAAILAAMGAPGNDGTTFDAASDDAWSDDELDFDALMANLRAETVDRLRDLVGGDEALAALDDDPLPDEDFSWTGIPTDIHDKVAEILELCDGSCDALLDVEHRTAVRRLLAAVATTSPEAFRRRGASNTAAAALCWVVAKRNLSFSQSPGGLTAKALAAHVGVTGSVSQRAGTLLSSAGLGRDHVPPQYLTGSRRARIMRLRDDHAESGGTGGW